MTTGDEDEEENLINPMRCRQNREQQFLVNLSHFTGYHCIPFMSTSSLDNKKNVQFVIKFDKSDLLHLLLCLHAFPRKH